MKLFEKVYPYTTEGSRFYYEGGLFFDLHDCSTNIPRQKQRNYRVPAANPEYAGKSLSVKTHIKIQEDLSKNRILCIPVSISGEPGL